MIPANEVRDRVLKQHAEEVGRAEGEIDKAILRCDTIGANVVVIVSGYLHQVVCDQLAEYYRDGGWHISHERHRATDQRDDDRTTFTLRPVASP